MKITNAVRLIVFSCWLGACGLHNPTPVSVTDSSATASPTGQLSIVKKLKEFDHLPVAERIALYYKLKKENPQDYNFKNEDELTMYGYSFLWNNKVTEAIAIFKLIVAEFPDSSNPYDSLGEAYLNNGDTELALANYAKSLALNPDNFNAEDQIERIKHPEKKPEKPADKFAKVFTAQAYKADLDQLGNTLLKVHPNALKFITREAFWKTIEEKKALITDRTTYSEFAWHCSEIIANVHCSHTGMGSFYFENDMLPPALKFPLQTRWVNDQLFVVDPLNNADKVQAKDEILFINGVAVATLIPEVYKHIPAQGYIQTTKKHVFNRWSSCMIPYALGFPGAYNIVVKGQGAPIALNRAETVNVPFTDTSIKQCDTDLCFEVLADNKTALLTIATFNYYPWNNLSVFVQFIDSCFVEIHKKGVKNLVIDLRFNGGGSQQSSIHLLRYLVNKPFIYYSNAQFEGKTAKIDGEETITPFESRFKGKCYFMIDGNGNSTTGHFMSLVKVLKLGTIVGEELGSNQFCSAGQKICRLSNTKLEYYVANNTHESTATSLPDEVGILPDHTVIQSIDDYLNKVDVVKAYTLNLMQAKETTYTLKKPAGWGAERFPIPIAFAPQIPYTGIEDLRFSPGWSNANSNDYWTYAFLWHLKGIQKTDEKIIADHLQAYYTGLITGNRNAADWLVNQKVTVQLKKVKTEKDASQTFQGAINMFDYMAAKPITLQCVVQVKHRPKQAETFIFYELSPKPHGDNVWQDLHQLWLDFSYD